MIPILKCETVCSNNNYGYTPTYTCVSSCKNLATYMYSFPPTSMCVSACAIDSSLQYYADPDNLCITNCSALSKV